MPTADPTIDQLVDQVEELSQEVGEQAGASVASSDPTPEDAPGTAPRAPTLDSMSRSTLEPIAVIADLQAQLPRDVWEAFHDSFYGACSEPRFETLRVEGVWSGRGEAEIEFTPPAGTYFLVAIADPTSSVWEFDSVLDTGRGRRLQSLQLGSNSPDELTDAQEWCHTGFGIVLSDLLQVQASGLEWTVYLVSSTESGELPRSVASALTGFYGLCPPLPGEEELEVIEVWTSEEELSNRALEFNGSPPHFFMGVQFEPDSDEWLFASVNVSGNWRVAGPGVNSRTTDLIDFTATCPSSASGHHLDVDARGGRWTVFLIGVSPDSSPSPTPQSSSAAIPSPTPVPTPAFAAKPEEAREALISGQVFSVELAVTSGEKFRGLSGRLELPLDAGMLFVYETELTLSFWMKDTLIPLDILFLDRERRIVNFWTMVPQPGVPNSELLTYRSEAPAMYALEVNAGVAGHLGLVPGMVVEFR